MGALNDFLGILQDFNHMGDDVMEDTFNRKRFSSMSKRALEGTMQFPTIVSRSIDIDTLQMITKALEKQFASFAQVAISMSPLLNLNKDKDPAGFLRKFHQNSNKGNTRDKVLNLLTYTDVNESYTVHVNEEEDLVLMSTVMEGSDGHIIATNREGLRLVLEGARENCLNDMYKPRSNIRTSDDYLRTKHTSVMENAKNGNGSSRPSTNNTPISSPDNKLPNRVLVDNDVKKANELVPTTMHIRTTMIDNSGHVHGNLDFIAGVKATMHPVASDDLVNNIAEAIKNRGKLFKLIRWTTGEIQFARDYMLNLTEIKEDAARTSDKNNRWWTALKRRKKLATLKKNLFLPGDILPNASIVLSIEEYEFIKQEFGFDLLDVRVSDKIMREYFLISMTIVDSAAQVAHFLFDGYEDYQTTTFSALERGDSNGDNINFKDVLKLVQRT